MQQALSNPGPDNSTNDERTRGNRRESFIMILKDISLFVSVVILFLALLLFSKLWSDGSYIFATIVLLSLGAAAERAANLGLH